MANVGDSRLTMPSKVSEPFRLTIVSPSPDNSVWLGGNGDWGDGANPGNPTYKTLQSVVDSINPTTGGWAELPNTTLDPVLLPRAVADAIDARIWQNEGSKSCVTVWASAAFDGKSLFVGCCGGHRAYAGNELYRIRIADAPAVVRMYDPAPLIAGGKDKPAWGQQAQHHYDAVHWIPQIGKSVWGGTNASGGLWAFDCNASTPKSAWSFLSPNPGGDIPEIGYGTMCMMTDTEIYNKGGPGGGSPGYVIDIRTGARRFPRRPQDAFDSSVGTIYDFGYMRRGSTARASRVYYTGGTSRNRAAHFIFAYDPITGKTSAPTDNRALPTWYATPANSPTYRSLQIAVGTWGERILGCQAGPSASHQVWCYDPAADAILEYLSPVAPRPDGVTNGLQGRWHFVPQVKAFVAIMKHTQNVWVFRPPAAWRIA